MSDPIFDVKNSFLYECDEVPFDEIPPEPGRLIEEESFGGIRIRVNKESVDRFSDSSSQQSPQKIQIDGTLKRTIHTSNGKIGRTIRPSSYDDYPEEKRSRPSYAHPAEGRSSRYEYDEEPRSRYEGSVPRHKYDDQDPKPRYDEREPRQRQDHDTESRYRDSTLRHDDHPRRHPSNEQPPRRSAERFVQPLPERFVQPPRDMRQASSERYRDCTVHKRKEADDYFYDDERGVPREVHRSRSPPRDERRHPDGLQRSTHSVDREISSARHTDERDPYVENPVDREIRSARHSDELRQVDRGRDNYDDRDTIRADQVHHADTYDGRPIDLEIRSAREQSSRNHASQKEPTPPVTTRTAKDRLKQPIQKTLSARLGPPVSRGKRPSPNPVRPMSSTKPISKPTALKSKNAPNFIERNIAASKLSQSKRLGPRPVKPNVLQPISRRQNDIKKIKTNNPFSKAKQRAIPQRTNLSKNIALSKNLASNSTVESKTKKMDTPSGSVIANLIQGILEEPDVKEMITTIAQQSVPEEATDVASSSFAEVNDQKKLALVADEILNKANNLLNNNFAQMDASQFQSNRPIPPPKTKAVRLGMYCISCRLEFPTSMLRDLHYKTEMHCFVNGDWWKFNPKPPERIPRHKYPITMFCILCWDIVRLQSEDSFSTHIGSKRHKANRNKFVEVFGHAPLHHWCMWEDLSINFRNNFVPVPAQLRNSTHPEYMYDQRVIRK